MAKIQILLLKAIINTVKFNLLAEWKSKFSILSVFIYIFISILITFLSLPGIDKPLFASVFWIVMIFTTLQGISKSFINMRKGHFAYWHQIVTPFQFLASKLISNAILMFIFTIFCSILFRIIHGNIIDDNFAFLITALITGFGIASIFTISSSIAVKTDNAGMLLPVLTFPLTVPIILIGLKASKKAVDGLGFFTILPEIGLLLLLSLLITGLGLLLIKFVWKD